MKQPGKEIGDEERIGKDQGPTHYSLKVNLDPSSLSRCLDPKNFLTKHLLLPQQFCKLSANLWNH